MSFYKVLLLGVPQVIAPDGSEVTPKSSKAIALLAILTVSQGRPWNRASLQDLLWSDRDQTHGRDSLKKVLRELRDCFNANGAEILKSRGGPVALEMSCVATDVFDEPAETGLCQQEFLAGIDVRDPQFEDWLRTTRQAIEGQRKSTPPPAPDTAEQRQRIHIAVMPTATTGPGETAGLFGDLILDRIIIAMRQYDVYRIYDYRDNARKGPSGAEFTLDLAALQLGGQFMLTLKCRRVLDGEIVWGQRLVFSGDGIGSGTIATRVCDLVDQVTDTLFHRQLLGDSQRACAARYAMDGIDHICRLKKGELKLAAASLRKAIDLDPRSSYLAWYAFLSAFELEAKKGQNVRSLREHADALARRALEIDPHNALTRSLLTHVYSFVFRDFARAESLIAPMASAAPDLALYHNSRALLWFYQGKLDQAWDAAVKANILGARSPFAFSYATTSSMIQIARGQLDLGVQHGEAALSLQAGRPKLYEPTLRYLAAAYALKGDSAAASRTLSKIRAQTPDFRVESVADQRFPIPSKHVRDLVANALRSVSVGDD